MLQLTKRLLFIFLVLGTLLPDSIVSQVYTPVKWSSKVKQKGNEATLVIQAKIEKNWHLYATQLPSDDGPIATEVRFEPSANYSINGSLVESTYKSMFDPIFEMDVSFHDKRASFEQDILVKSTDDFVVNGTVYFMVCDDTKCLPPEEVEFRFEVKGTKGDPTQQPIVSANNDFSASSFNPTATSQVFDPVHWKNHVEKIDDANFALVYTAQIDPNWHLYALTLPSDEGPVATEFTFDTLQSVFFNGEVVAGEPFITKYDPNFDMDLNFYENEVSFYQFVKGKSSGSFWSMVYFMTCDDKRCLPPEEIEFNADLSEAVPASESTLNIFENLGKNISSSDQQEASDAKKSLNETEGKSLWGIFLVALLAGILALLTPCVFPMVPMTISFFTKQSQTIAQGKVNAFTYGFFIVLIYVLLSIPFHLFDSISPDVLNEISTNVWLNLFFFIIFIVFAISFFGAFEITMPNSWINKADKASDVGGIIGIFFMAIVLVLVSFSCTGPILGALLGGTLSSDGGAMALTVGMLGFGIGLGGPFTVFALFPGLLNSLPKSGGWLNTVKVFLGFLELALAFKFLSNADLVIQANIITREVFIAIWIAVFGILAFYLFGAFRLPHDSKLEKLSVGRLLLAVLVTWFTIYLIPGMWGAPLKLISGFPPPAFYSEAPKGVGYKGSSTVSINAIDKESIPEGADPEHCPHNLNCFHDYETGMAYAKEVGKPVMLDFTGWACVNCRKMEEQVWSDPRVLEKLNNELVLISLYVDERTPLPVDEQHISQTTGKKIKTIGNKWSDFQVSKFGNNSQPYYVFLDHEGNQIGKETAYDPDIQLYLQWLDKGIEAFNEKN